MSSQPNQSLIDGIRCFQELTTNDGPIGTKELSEKLGINTVRVNRLLQTLKSIGMAEQNANKKYLPGPAVHLLAAQSFHSSALFQSAINIAINTSYSDRTLAIGVLWHDSVVFMYHASAEQNPAEGLGGYHIYHVSQSSIGQALLATFTDEEIQHRIAGWLPEQRIGILEKIESARKNGFIRHCDENNMTTNISSVFSVDGAKAGIAFTDLHLSEDSLNHYVTELNMLIHKIEHC